MDTNSEGRSPIEHLPKAEDIQGLSDEELMSTGEDLTALHYDIEQILEKITDEAVRRGLEERREDE